MLFSPGGQVIGPEKALKMRYLTGSLLQTGDDGIMA